MTTTAGTPEPLPLKVNHEDLRAMTQYQKAYQHMLNTPPPKRGHKKATAAYHEAARDFALWMEVRLDQSQKVGKGEPEEE
ncbi:hypothetical protein [Pseudomonas gregormendelii]